MDHKLAVLLLCTCLYLSLRSETENSRVSASHIVGFKEYRFGVLIPRDTELDVCTLDH